MEIPADGRAAEFMNYTKRSAGRLKKYDSGSAKLFDQPQDNS
jgi:hypothetical protein